MAFVSSGYNPDKPMENRISDIGPRKFDEFYPPVIAKNKGTWLYHEYIQPGVYFHTAKSGDKVYTVRVGGARLMSTTHIREICDIAEKHCDGYMRFTTRNNIEFMVDSEDKVKPLIEDLESRKFAGGSFKFPVGGTGAGESDLLTIEGTATLDGMLDLSFIDGYPRQRGERITFLTATEGISGGFVNALGISYEDGVVAVVL